MSAIAKLLCTIYVCTFTVLCTQNGSLCNYDHFPFQDLQDDMQDMLEQANEVMDVMGRPYGIGDEVDEDDLEAGQSD